MVGACISVVRDAIGKLSPEIVLLLLSLQESWQMFVRSWSQVVHSPAEQARIGRMRGLFAMAMVLEVVSSTSICVVCVAAALSYRKVSVVDSRKDGYRLGSAN